MHDVILGACSMFASFKFVIITLVTNLLVRHDNMVCKASNGITQKLFVYDCNFFPGLI